MGNDWRYLRRGGHQVDHRIQQARQADLGRAGSHEHRGKSARPNHIDQSAHDLFGAQLLAFQVLLQQGVFAFGGGFDQLHTGRFDVVHVVGRDITHGLAIACVSFHRQQIDHAFEIGFFTPGKLDGDQAHLRDFVHRLERFGEIGIIAVHFVDDHKARQLELIAVVPGDLGAHFCAGNRIDHHQRAIGHAQRRNHLTDEIGVTRRIQQVDLVIAIFDREHGRRQRKPAPDFFIFEIRGGGAIFDLSQAGGRPGKVQECLASMVFPAPLCETRAMLRIKSVVYSFIVLTFLSLIYDYSHPGV